MKPRPSVCISPPVRDRLEPSARRVGRAKASAWNAARHPAKSGVSSGDASHASRALRQSIRHRKRRCRTDRRTERSDRRRSRRARRRRRISSNRRSTPASPISDGKVGEGTLDALGFVRHRDDDLNAVDAPNVRFHVTGRSKAFQAAAGRSIARIAPAFEQLGADVSPKTWYRLFVNAPFLGRPFDEGHPPRADATATAGREVAPQPAAVSQA